MKRTQLVLRRVLELRPAQLGIVVGVAVGAAVLTGALLVGDSVRQSLRTQAGLRIGKIEAAMDTGPRPFREELSGELAAALEGATVAPALRHRGIATARGGRRRALEVQVLGVDTRFFALAPEDGGRPPRPGEVLVNARLARQLDVGPGERIVLRLESASPVPGETVLGSADTVGPGLAVQVGGVVAAASFGHFDLRASPLPPLLAMVPLSWLQERLDLEGGANLLLLGNAGSTAAARAQEALTTRWRLADAGLLRREISSPEWLELASTRVFLDPVVVRAVAEMDHAAMGVATWLATELRRGTRSVPYALITALGPLGTRPDDPRHAPWRALVPQPADRDAIVINTWVAEDLEAARGDALVLRCIAPGERGDLREIARTLEIERVVPIAGLAADRELMPPFPGIAGSGSCRDWDPAFPIDLARIRERDEAWWRERGGTPKAFLSLALAEQLWGGSRFGFLTAVRVPSSDAATFFDHLRAELDPTVLGLVFRDVRTPALRASSPATDFGGLFIGLSLFLLVSAFLLVALLVALDVERRAPEVGTLLALGFRRSTVRRLLLGELALLALPGSLLGAALGALYARGVLLGLSTIWKDAVAGATLASHVRLPMLALGAGAALATALATAWIVIRRQHLRPAAELLATRSGVGSGWRAPHPRARRRATVLALALCGLGVALAIAGTGSSGPARPALSFAAGCLMLVGAILTCRRALMASAGRHAQGVRSAAALAALGARRRPGRSLATVALIASGAFLVIVVGLHRQSAPDDPSVRRSGTGGFALIGRSAAGFVPPRTRLRRVPRFELAESQPPDVEVVPLRVRDGDDASCLNLNRPQTPRLLGVRPEALAERGAFTFARSLDDARDRSPWLLLGDSETPAVIPAIADEASVTWSLHLALGETLQDVDERGEPFELRIVATLAGSILQGSLLIDAHRFTERFPSEVGWRAFLIDAPAARAATVAEDLMIEHADLGLELASTSARLEDLNAVQNTYLAVFQALGGLGLLLGSAGLAVVLLRNVFERRRELALLGAVGFRERRIRGMLVGEHAVLVAAGLGCGALAALIASLPMAGDGGAGVPILPLTLLVALMLGSGLLWVWLAARMALRGPLLEALRDA